MGHHPHVHPQSPFLHGANELVQYLSLQERSR